MIETIYKATCDNCKERSQQNAMLLLQDFVKMIMAIGWRRINSAWHCPFCVRSLSAERPPRRSPKAGKLSRTAREALQQRLIDDEERS